MQGDSHLYNKNNLIFYWTSLLFTKGYMDHNKLNALIVGHIDVGQRGLGICKG
jgi:hypothetical protein